MFSDQLIYEQFLRDSEFQRNEPATEQQFCDIEKEFQVKLPEAIKSLLQICNGGRATRDDHSDLVLFSLHEAIQCQEDFGSILQSRWGYLPFAENNDSNPICICCKSALSGYIVQVNHDDMPRLKYRSITGFFQAVMEYTRRGQFLDTYSLSTDFDGGERTSADLEASHGLLQAAAHKDSRLKPDDQIDEYRFACDLLPDVKVEEISALLKVRNEYVQDHVIARLKKIDTAASRKVASQFLDDRDEFAEYCVRVLKQAGLDASVHQLYGWKNVRVDPGPHWLNIKMLYCRRDDSNFSGDLVNRVRSWLSAKD